MSAFPSERHACLRGCYPSYAKLLITHVAHIEYRHSVGSYGLILSDLGLSRHHLEQQEQGAQDMLQNATLIAHSGKEDTAAEPQSHAGRTQDTLMGAVENAQVAEIRRAMFAH